MRIKLISACCLCLALMLFSPSLYALKPKAKYFKSQEEADCYLATHYNLGCKYYNEKEWRKASSEFEKVIFYFPSSDAAAEASYYLAVSYFEMKEYDFANEEFSNYLKASQHPAFFEDAVAFKFCIAEHFKLGKRRHPFKMRYLPKWISGQDSALVIYDEVIAALPNHELALRALYSKGELFKQMREYRDSIEAYQTIIRRFPKNEIVPACYLNIADAYVQQARVEFQNPDILALAELNVRKFQNDFPRDERVAIAEESVCHIKEMYAKGLCDLGLFYERIHQPDAAAIYFQSSIEEFPDTRVAQFCRSRLICMGYLQEEVCSGEDEDTAPFVEQPTSPREEATSCTEQSILEQPAFAEQLAFASYVEQSGPYPYIEQPAFSLEQPTPPPAVYQPNRAWEPMPIQSQKQAPVYYEEILPQQEQGQEYIHYSLTKKREVRSLYEERQSSAYQQEPSTRVGENPNPYDETPNYDNAPNKAWHYSTIKHRDQYVPGQD